MSKDPAFLLYHQDFYTGVSDMTNEEIGAYFLCLLIQASKGGITEKHMLIICKSQDVHNVVKSKFVLNYESNLLENLRLKTEIKKRKEYSESRSKNRKNKQNTDTIQDKQTKTYVNHMEDEDEIVNENKKEIDFEKIIQIFNFVCKDLPRVEKITVSRKKAISIIIKDHSLDKLELVFKLTSESDYLNGKISDWNANFDWIVKPNNFIKILEGNYKNKANEKQKPTFVTNRDTHREN
jgi:uncharacterized protein YdaU (DUF1376 family)